MKITAMFMKMKTTNSTEKTHKNQNQSHIAAFHTQRPGIYSICLSRQKDLATIFVMKTDQVRPFSTTTGPTTEQYAGTED